MRRIWIVSKGTDIDNKARIDAKMNGCTEIARGIPPRLKKELAFQSLPRVYEEPESPIPEKPRDIIKELDELKAKVELLEKS